MQINVLQRVIAKKTDPTTHKKFSDVLRLTVTNNPSLAASRLLDVFWERFIPEDLELQRDFEDNRINSC